MERGGQIAEKGELVGERGEKQRPRQLSCEVVLVKGTMWSKEFLGSFAGQGTFSLLPFQNSVKKQCFSKL